NMNNPKVNRILTEIIRTNLTEEQIKQNLGDLESQREETVEQVLKSEDKQKLAAYDDLEAKGLPEKVFGNQNPSEIENQIKNLTKEADALQSKYKQIAEELDDYVQRKTRAESEKTEKELEECENQGWENKIRLVLGLEEDELFPNDWHNQLINKQQLALIQDLLGEKSRTQEVAKEIKNKDSEITILHLQIEELGGTVGANPILKKFLEWREMGTSEQKRAIIKY
ncbi:7398_t:CDS:2, partial [Scutellospora calospora]